MTWYPITFPSDWYQSAHYHNPCSHMNDEVCGQRSTAKPQNSTTKKQSKGYFFPKFPLLANPRKPRARRWRFLHILLHLWLILKCLLFMLAWLCRQVEWKTHHKVINLNPTKKVLGIFKPPYIRIYDIVCICLRHDIFSRSYYSDAIVRGIFESPSYLHPYTPQAWYFLLILLLGRKYSPRDFWIPLIFASIYATQAWFYYSDEKSKGFSYLEPQT
jgi:hypothetical protein